ncbi:MAG: glutamine--fructose-6-phosphate transaminase (isomerizing) [Candidatus Brocadiaceae bacterium]|mgnify:CR=1 FL=1|nr:glutamine--fructose-6-phosphate transaminase (isomerizing) [Candidatus Brocadiaceae bacterium]
MCGIFGCVGPRAGVRVLMEGLKRLEYRGYDSWGFALGHAGGLLIHRRAGEISAAPPPAADPAGCWGVIGHTRWATHGPATERNAHPHTDCAGRLALVHNGIVENHAELRAGLEARGHVFRSETDTEVIAHLMEECLKDGEDFRSAFLSALKVLEGPYAVAALSLTAPGVVLAARRGSPMVLGVGQGEMLLASDVAALIDHTRDAVYLDDGEAAAVTGEGFKTFDLDSAPLTKKVRQIACDLPEIQRGGYAHFMLKEIFEQPDTVRNALRGRIVRAAGMAKLGGIDERLLRAARRCHIVACGTSWHAGLVGKYLLENLARVPTQVSYAAEFRYARPVIEPGTLVIAVSQSGETADTLAAVREVRRQGTPAIGVCNVVGSSIARECGQGVYLHAGPEIGVASTKAFTSQVAVLALLAMHMGRMRDMPLRDALRYLDALERLPEQVEEALGCEGGVREIADEFFRSANALYVGRLYEFPVALEGALKLKETSYVHAEGIPAAELKHGPIALVDREMPVVVLAAQSGVLGKVMNNVEEIRARGGRIIAVARAGDDRLPRLAERTVFVPATLDPLVPMLAVVPLQLLAYHVAVRRGCNVDRPRNLAKSVTVE